ncbi:SOS response-associated peptidase family protein [Winogradskyella epiphytica]|nr:SOS response-associated peptidase family protein [Winogradskyella epiphytica]
MSIESTFDAKFKFPLLYRTSPIINGLSEQSLPIITMDQSQSIDYAIWGLLPQNFNEGWESFQNLSNTLNMSLDNAQQLDWINNLLMDQRCAIIVSGFFTSYYYNGEIYPFYVYEKDHKPFALAGVYSILNDGFLTVSLLTSSLKDDLKGVHNLGNDFPIALSHHNYEEWLSQDLDLSDEGIINLQKLELKAHTISKEFYKNDIVFDSILERAQYSKVPVLSIK